MTKRAIIPSAFADAARALNMSPGILSGDHLFLTGTTGGDGSGKISSDPKAQFEMVFEKIGIVLAEAGLGFEAVVEMTSYHLGLRDHFEVFDQVRLTHFDAPYPAWTAVEVAGLRREGAIVEVRVIARAANGT